MSDAGTTAAGSSSLLAPQQYLRCSRWRRCCCHSGMIHPQKNRLSIWAAWWCHLKKRFRITIRSKLVHHAVDTKQPKTEVGGIPPPNSRPPPQRDTHTSVHHTHRYLKRARYYRCLKKWPTMVYRCFQASKYLLWHGAFFRASSDYSKEISKHCILTNVTSRCPRPGAVIDPENFGIRTTLSRVFEYSMWLVSNAP